MTFSKIICLHTTIRNAANVASGEITDELDFVNIQRIKLKSTSALREITGSVITKETDYQVEIKIHFKEGSEKLEAEMMCLLTQEIRKQQNNILKNLQEAVRLMQFCVDNSEIEVI